MSSPLPIEAISPSTTAGRTSPGERDGLPGGRLISLDMFRGLTMVLMILVNNPGTWSAVYWPLLHAEWHGWTPTDLVFPFFLFIVGVAVVFAFTKRLEAGVAPRDLISKTVKRGAILFGLGLLLSAFPFVHFYPEFGLAEQMPRLRIMGVLQRIALCYVAASVLFLYARPRTRLWTGVIILLGYWAALALVPVPGYGAGLVDDPAGNLASYLDRLLMGNHLWAGANFVRDPEGLFSTFPALVTALLGVWTGRLLIDEKKGPFEKTARLMVTGMLLFMVGSFWGLFFPVNKALWTSSYVLVTGGLAMLVLGLCYWWIDVQGHRTWTRPFVMYGVNAITVFFLSGIVGRSLALIHVGPAGALSLQEWIFQTIFMPIGPLELASLAYAVVWVLGWFLVLYGMYRRDVIIRV